MNLEALVREFLKKQVVKDAIKVLAVESISFVGKKALTKVYKKLDGQEPQIETNFDKTDNRLNRRSMPKKLVKRIETIAEE